MKSSTEVNLPFDHYSRNAKHKKEESQFPDSPLLFRDLVEEIAPLNSYSLYCEQVALTWNGAEFTPDWVITTVPGSFAQMPFFLAMILVKLFEPVTKPLYFTLPAN